MITGRYDDSWDVPERVLEAQINMRCEGIADLASDLRELADAIERCEMPERWLAANCPHSVQMDSAQRYDDADAQEAYVASMTNLAKAWLALRHNQ